MPTATTKASILESSDRQPIRVPTPEWGGDTWLLPLSGNDLDRYDQLSQDKRWPEDEDEADWSGLRAILVAMAHCDEQGNVFGYSDLEIIVLGKRNGAAINRCFKAVRDASGLSAEAVEEAEKNLPGGQTESSG